jgi:hypothetical protein
MAWPKRSGVAGEDSRGRAVLFIDYSEEARTFCFLLQWQFILGASVMAEESMVRLWTCGGGIDGAINFCGLVLRKERRRTG